MNVPIGDIRETMSAQWWADGWNKVTRIYVAGPDRIFDELAAALVRAGESAFNRPSGDCAASAMPPDAIVEWQPEIETQEMAILRAEVQWRSAQGTATRDRALCETAHFGQEQSG